MQSRKARNETSVKARPGVSPHPSRGSASQGTIVQLYSVIHIKRGTGGREAILRCVKHLISNERTEQKYLQFLNVF